MTRPLSCCASARYFSLQHVWVMCLCAFLAGEVVAPVVTAIIVDSPERENHESDNMSEVLDEDEQLAISKGRAQECGIFQLRYHVLLAGEVQREVDLLHAALRAQGCHGSH